MFVCRLHVNKIIFVYMTKMVNMSIDEVITENGIMTDELYESHCYNIHSLKFSSPAEVGISDSKWLDGALREYVPVCDNLNTVLVVL